MKNLILSMVGCLLATVSFSQYSDGGSYMNAISKEYRSIQEDMWDYTSAAAHGKKANTVEQLRAELEKTAYGAKGKVSRMPDYEGNSAYRDSVVSFLNIYYIVLKEDYAKIVDMEAIAEQSYDLMEAYMLAKEEANNKLSEASAMLDREQEKFAKEFDVELITEEDDLSKKMAKADKVYEYYNKIYLIFFKSYIQDIYLTEAIAKGDVSAIEQNRSALQATADEGLLNLKSITSFDGDMSVVQACQDLLRFYKDQAKNKIKDITDYYLKAENFQTIQKSFDAKKDADRTQEDIDRYNNAVAESNEAAARYNETIAVINKDREDKLNNWNKTVLKFTDKHVPKGKAK